MDAAGRRIDAYPRLRNDELRGELEVDRCGLRLKARALELDAARAERRVDARAAFADETARAIAIGLALFRAADGRIAADRIGRCADAAEARRARIRARRQARFSADFAG